MRFFRRAIRASLILTFLLLVGGGMVFMNTLGKLFSTMDQAMQTAGQPITPDAETHGAISGGDALGVMAGLLDNPRGLPQAEGTGRSGSGGMIAKLLGNGKILQGLTVLAKKDEMREGLSTLINDPALEAELAMIMASPNAETVFQALAQDPRVQAALLELVSSPQAQQNLLQFATEPAVQQQVLAQIDDPDLKALVSQTLADPEAKAALAQFAKDPAAHTALLASLTGGTSDDASPEALVTNSGLDPTMIASLMPSVIAAVQVRGGPIPGYTPLGVAPTPAPPPTAPVMTGNSKITVNEYIRVHAGMRMPEVVEILGAEGAEVATATMDGVVESTHIWLNVDGSYVIVIMRADMVLDASQQNLPLKFD